MSVPTEISTKEQSGLPARTVRQIGAFLLVDLISFVRFWYMSFFMIAMTTFYYLMLTRYAASYRQLDVTVLFVILAVLSVSLFHFGSRASMERAESWNPFVRTLPAPMWVKFAARLILVLFAGFVAAILIMVAGTLRFGLTYDLDAVLTVAVVVPVAAVVFAPLCACIGAALPPAPANAVTTVVFLTVTWSAGVWTGGQMPEPLAHVDFLLPVQATFELSTAVTAMEWLDVMPRIAVAGLWVLPPFLLARSLYTRIR